MLSNTAACSSQTFLCAVLWFDLMFDVQVFPYLKKKLPKSALDSICEYYKRVTIDASPMGKFVGIVMLFVVVSHILEFLENEGICFYLSILSFCCSFYGMLLASIRTLPYAMRLGRGKEDVEVLNTLAFQVFYDHASSLCFMCIAVIIQLYIAAIK